MTGHPLPGPSDASVLSAPRGLTASKTCDEILGAVPEKQMRPAEEWETTSHNKLGWNEAREAIESKVKEIKNS